MEWFSIRKKQKVVFKKKQKDPLLVEEQQYRAVITFDNNARVWKASVQRRVAVDEWKRVQCGLKNSTFTSQEQAESIARWKIKEQKALDSQGKAPISYIIYDD